MPQDFDDYLTGGPDPGPISVPEDYDEDWGDLDGYDYDEDFDDNDFGDR